MVLQFVVGAAWLIWLSSGMTGLKNGLMVGAFLVMGFGLKNVLDTFWKQKEETATGTREEDPGLEKPSRVSPQKRAILPLPNWTGPRLNDADSSTVLRRFERRLADPRV